MLQLKLNPIKRAIQIYRKAKGERPKTLNVQTKLEKSIKTHNKGVKEGKADFRKQKAKLFLFPFP